MLGDGAAEEEGWRCGCTRGCRLKLRRLHRSGTAYEYSPTHPPNHCTHLWLQGHSGSGQTDVAVQAASARPMAPADLQKAVGQHLGGEAPLAATSWDLAACDFSAGLFVPAAAVKEARRQAVTALLAARRSAAGATAAGLVEERDVLGELLARVQQEGSGISEAAEQWEQWEQQERQQQMLEQQVKASTSDRTGAVPMLRVLCRSKAQVDAALALPWLEELVLDFLEVHGWALRQGGALGVEVHACVDFE